MGRGRTTTGMISACLISSTMKWESHMNEAIEEDEVTLDMYNTMDGPSEEEVYLSGEFPSLPITHCLFWYFFVCKGEYKTILQLVGVLSHGKIAKRLTDRAIDLMQDVQNLRKAIYEFVLSHVAETFLCLIWFFGGVSYKLKVDACEKGSAKERKLRNITVNYLYVCSLFFVPLHFIWWEIGIDMVRWSFSPIIWLRGGNRGKVRRRRSLNGFVSIGKLPSYLGGGRWISPYRIAGWRFNGLCKCIHLVRPERVAI